MIIPYLILSHLVADFILQPGKLINWKAKSAYGVLFHVVVFFLTALLFLFPYLIYWQTWAVIAGISVVHFLSDFTKVKIEKKKESFPLPFITDQLIHLLSLVAGGYILELQNFTVIGSRFFEAIYSNWLIWFLIAFVIYVTYVLNVIFMQKAYLTSYNLKAREQKNRILIIQKKLATFTFVYIFFVAAALVSEMFI